LAEARDRLPTSPSGAYLQFLEDRREEEDAYRILRIPHSVRPVATAQW
jgi:hypothetical protein